jgi:hypothetical protein
MKLIMTQSGKAKSVIVSDCSNITFRVITQLLWVIDSDDLIFSETISCNSFTVNNCNRLTLPNVINDCKFYECIDSDQACTNFERQ